ncbi:MAG TPA: TetR/AcrR family transcriptional regulator [Nannocystaceae bacterium]|nr:TetR/AcrR family transcriptional regulator [Nannocystaceae bacterium]
MTPATPPAAPPPELLDIARRLVDEGGPEALTMERLAEAAGISRSSAYRQVGSREAPIERLAAAGVDVGERGQVRPRVLKAAAEVFSRQGFDAATIEAIAEAAGVGTATVYRHFGDKKGLVAAFLQEQSPRRAVWSAAREPSGDLAADLERLARAALEEMARNGPLMRLMLLEQLRGSDLLSELATSPDRTIHALAAIFRAHVARGALVDEDPYRLARAFQSLVLGFGLLGPLWQLPGAGDPASDARLLTELFLHGATRGAR